MKGNKKMTKYEITKENFDNGIIVVEQMHSGKLKHWFATSEQDFLERVQAEATLYRTFCDVKTFEEAVEFTRKEVKGLYLLRQDEIDPEWCENSPEVAKLALTYGWAVEIEED
jgi:hypothetical protein